MLEEIIEILTISNDVSWTEVDSVASEIIIKINYRLGQKNYKSPGQKKKTREMKRINFTEFFFWIFSESKILIFMENIQKLFFS